jgi:BirA family transcriptional regulator, biotin operon repressor / biotin---[acetyl-CoA-carboxylase] ligase
MDTAPLEAAAIAADLGTHEVPRTISCHGAVGSTMDLSRELLARLGPGELPALVVADEQTAGRGRLGRPWVAPPGSALLASLVLRPTWLAPEHGVALVWMSAVALCEAIEATTPLRPGLKWPNDVLVARGADLWAKVAGILLELSLGPTGIESAVIGSGINVSAAPPPEATRYPATSLSAASGAPVERLVLLRAYLRSVDSWHARLRAGEDEALFAAWRARLITLGQRVRIEAPGGPLEGLAESVDRSGALLVRDDAGLPHIVTAGDVGLVP